MIFQTAYDTTLGRAFHIYSIEQEIKKAIIQNGGEYFRFKKYDVISSVDFLPLELSEQNTRFVQIGRFQHPMIVGPLKDQKYLALDSRFFLKDTENGDDITNKNEYEFAIKRYAANFAWINTKPLSIKLNLHFSATIFTYWLSEIIGRRFVLDPLDQSKLAIVTNFYYQQLFSDKQDLDDLYKQELMSFAIKTTKLPVKLITEIVDQITIMNSVEDYCVNIERILDNIRMRGFNAGSLFTLVGMNWYGLNAKENIAIATEHVPTWLAICYSAINNRSYKNTTIANVAMKFSKNDSAQEYIRNFEQMFTDFFKPIQTKVATLSIEEELAKLESFNF